MTATNKRKLPSELLNAVNINKRRRIENIPQFDALCGLKQEIANKMSDLKFTIPSHIYNPLDYAWPNFEKYLKLITIPTQPLNNKLDCSGKCMLLGMNPGPHGMTQSGIPFGDCYKVKSWMNMNEIIKLPKLQNPKRRVVGLNYHRKEISGTRIYEWAQSLFGDDYPFKFFSKFFIFNYCPLCFLKDAKNITPQKLDKINRAKLYELCDDQLIETINIMKPKYIVGIGNFAHEKVTKILIKMKNHKQLNNNNDMFIDFKIEKITHPSPANPKSHTFHIDATVKLKNLGIL